MLHPFDTNKFQKEYKKLKLGSKINFRFIYITIIYFIKSKKNKKKLIILKYENLFNYTEKRTNLTLIETRKI